MMLTSRWNNINTTRLPLILPNLGDTYQQRPVLQSISHRPLSTDSTRSIDNAYSLEHLFTALRRRIHRIVQSYNATSFYNSLKICARIFRSYASYNLNTIDGFARLLSKSSRDNKKILTFIDQFRLQLSELRHCHSTFEAELLVTTLAIDFHENDAEQQRQQILPLSTGKFSPRSRFSKFRLHHIRQATELKTQLKQTNEQLQILLFDEFNANLTNLWDESEKYLTTAIPFHDHHMTYVLRLIPDIALKFEYALQLCTKLFDLETTITENFPINNNHNNNNNNNNNNNHSIQTPPIIMTLTPRSDFNQQIQDIPQHDYYEKIKEKKKSKKPSTFFSADVTSASSVSSNSKLINSDQSPMNTSRHKEQNEIINHQDDNLIFPSLFPSNIKPNDYKNDQTKLQLLIEQLEKRLMDEESYRKRLINCLKQTAKKSEQINKFPKTNNMLALVMTDEPAIAEYQKTLYLNDYHIHKSVADELSIAIRETQHRIDWINTVRARARQCLAQ